MGRRTDELTEFAKPIADDLAETYGSLKRVLSAGVLSLAAQSAERQRFFLAAAGGKNLTHDDNKPPSKEEFERFLADFENIVAEAQRPARRSTKKRTG